ncbi:MAG: 5'-nucleotidase C-terminal domain-containing protein [Bacteroidetes bacterium]|nr:5'-nucleotidase C-terminal domain-containing protein [Bacteroidota bacterium]
MLRRLLTTAILALSLSLSLSFAQTPSYVTILHLNDTHANLAPGAPRDMDGNATVGGIARAATVIATEKMADPNALVLHAGDAFIGDPSYNFTVSTLTIPELQLLLQLGVDAMTVGNHEFDLGDQALLGCLATTFATTGFPLLSANLDYSAEPTHPLQGFISPYIVKTAGDLTIGIFGMTTPEVEQTGTAAPIVVSDDIFTIAAAQVAELQTAGCDVIIFLSHLGYMYDYAIAESVPGIHLIVGGHDHFAFTDATEVNNPAGGTTWIVQAGAFYRTMGKTRLKVDQGMVSLEDYSLIALDETVDELEPIKTAVDDIYAQLDLASGGLLTTTVGVATGELSEWIPDCTSEGNLDTHVGNLCADAFAAATMADIAIQPGGSTAQPIYPGPIQALDLFRTIGYGMNEENGIGFGVITVDMTGLSLYAAIEGTLSFIELYDEMLLHPSAALTYSFNPEAPAGSRVHTLNYNGAPIDFEATYTVAMNELLLAYTDFFTSLDPRISYTNLQTFQSSIVPGPMTELEALMGYVAAVQTLSPDPLPGRVTSLVTPVEPTASLPNVPVLEGNFPNPFGAMTALRFTLPARMHAAVTVYDVVGREIAVLADREFSAGTHNVLFRPDALPSGLYFCRLLAGGTQQTVRMLHTR